VIKKIITAGLMVASTFGAAAPAFADWNPNRSGYSRDYRGDRYDRYDRAERNDRWRYANRRDRWDRPAHWRHANGRDRWERHYWRDGQGRLCYRRYDGVRRCHSPDPYFGR